MNIFRIAPVAGLLCGGMLSAQTAKVDFAKDVLPILRQNCIGCHGPAQQMSGLRLDRKSAVISRRGVVPGSSENSFLFHRLKGNEYGMQMPPTKLLIFGNPKAGTPLMLAAPSAALDLPLKILVAEDAQRKVSLSYNSPQYLKDRHGLPPNIAVIETLAAKAAE